jgi:hypothetical protein
VNQRGNIALYLLFSLSAATGVGYGVYVLLRDQPKTAAAIPPPDRNPDMPARPSPGPTEPPETPSAPPVDMAERDAVPPADIENPEADVVLLGTPGVAGALEASKVERTMKRYNVRWERCMRRARERGALQRGDLRLSFVIGADGDVLGVESASSLDPELVTCVTDTLKKLRFDRPIDGAMVKVVYPMRFVPARDESDPLER